MVTTMALIYGNMVQSTTESYNVQKERLENQVKTDIEIKNITFDNATNPHTTTIFVQNTGSNKVELDYLDVFIDEIKITRSENNRTISFAEGSEHINPLHWDPDETIKIEVFLNLTNITRIATVTTEHSVKDSMIFLG
jgi:archaellum component FlaF (FlaF/FlaG flagellin family)